MQWNTDGNGERTQGHNRKKVEFHFKNSRMIQKVYWFLNLVVLLIALSGKKDLFCSDYFHDNTKEVEDASGEREQECWFGEGYLESSEMESGSWRGCC